MLGGYVKVKEVRAGKSCVSENPIDVVLEERCIGIGNLEALRSRGFILLGCEVTDDGHLALWFDVKLPEIQSEIQQ